ncbi:MAG: hypothetical protein ACYDAY_11940 [Candidatus Dormibacteria bacterium]
MNPRKREVLPAVVRVQPYLGANGVEQLVAACQECGQHYTHPEPAAVHFWADNHWRQHRRRTLG